MLLLKLYNRTLVNPIDIKNGLGTLCLCKPTAQKCDSNMTVVAHTVCF